MRGEETGGEEEAAEKGEGKYTRTKRIAFVGALLIIIAYCSAVVIFFVAGKIVFPTDDFRLLLTFPPTEQDKFWSTTFGGRNIEVRSVAGIESELRERIARNNAKYGMQWKFKKVFIVGHGVPGGLIFRFGGARFTIDDVWVFSLIRWHVDDDTEIVIRACSMLANEKGFDFIRELARTANCSVVAWSDVGMYNGLVHLGDKYRAHPNGKIVKIDTTLD